MARTTLAEADPARAARTGPERIGGRPSHTWFVLHELLGFRRIRNYDGSWTEWGSMVEVPIER